MRLSLSCKQTISRSWCSKTVVIHIVIKETLFVTFRGAGVNIHISINQMSLYHGNKAAFLAVSLLYRIITNVSCDLWLSSSSLKVQRFYKGSSRLQERDILFFFILLSLFRLILFLVTIVACYWLTLCSSSILVAPNILTHEFSVLDAPLLRDYIHPFGVTALRLCSSNPLSLRKNLKCSIYRSCANYIGNATVRHLSPNNLMRFIFRTHVEEEKD
jgi:hypothetical protein